MTYQITDCRNLGSEELCAAMNTAFSDYDVPLSMTIDKFKDFQKQRGYSAEHSFVSMNGSGIAGFWLSSAPRPAFAGRGYAISVGTDPRHRRQGIVRTLFETVLEKQKSEGASGLQLEVITTNEKAVNAYRSFGFKTQRGLRVCKVPKSGLSNPDPNNLKLETLTLEDLPDDESNYFDAQPTPQNSRAALAALHDKIHLWGVRQDASLIGWAASYEDGSVAQIGVHKEHRRRGVGRALLSALGKSVGSGYLTFVNVDAASKNTNAFLDKAGAEDHVSQFEMHLSF
ncbi:GNAT family N-acetyltransferase [uncultured Roseibium sp.]|uniref:GNAT family N-acetyltransferase n=1 Tax=uncultured Roseibium sp. TaxID=1936171 RepID=UPI002633A4BD|nr:GNAT family N-acetyltransferase [uncultured Roseibium sp.]